MRYALARVTHGMLTAALLLGGGLLSAAGVDAWTAGELHTVEALFTTAYGAIMAREGGSRL